MGSGSILSGIRRPRSLRLKVFLVVVGGVLLPLGVVGFWLVRGVERSGETVLRARLASSLDPVVAGLGGRWVQVRAELLNKAQSSAATATAQVEPPRGVTVSLPLYSRGGDSVGTISTKVPVASLLPSEAASGTTVGAVLAVFDRTTGASLVPLPLDPLLLRRNEFTWGGERWVVARRTLSDPPVVLAAAAPLEPYTAPLRSVARGGAIALAAVAAGVLVLMTVVIGRLTSSLEDLAEAADAVSQGDLERHVRANGSDEVDRVARAFNTMTANLRQTLRDLAQRESLAAVGEFAASLAHEIRNPLTSIRIDLQRAEEKLPAGSELRGPLSRALTQVARLDRTVGGALRVARGGAVGSGVVDVCASLEQAMHAAAPAFAERDAQLQPLSSECDVPVDGDASALEQVFINLLLNAAQALGPGGRAGIRVAPQEDHVEVEVWDDGCGMPPDVQARVFQPFYSTKPEGTGLGLAVARQIVLGHRGEISIETEQGCGTRVTVRLPTRGSRNGVGTAG